MRKIQFYINLFLISYTSLDLVYWIFYSQKISGLLQLVFVDLLVVFVFALFVFLRKSKQKVKSVERDDLFAFRRLFSEGRER